MAFGGELPSDGFERTKPERATGAPASRNMVPDTSADCRAPRRRSRTYGAPLDRRGGSQRGGRPELSAKPTDPPPRTAHGCGRRARKTVAIRSVRARDSLPSPLGGLRRPQPRIQAVCLQPHGTKSSQGVRTPQMGSQRPTGAPERRRRPAPRRSCRRRPSGRLIRQAPGRRRGGATRRTLRASGGRGQQPPDAATAVTAGPALDAHQVVSVGVAAVARAVVAGENGAPIEPEQIPPQVRHTFHRLILAWYRPVIR
jgi:hypothetical protein